MRSIIIKDNIISNQATISIVENIVNIMNINITLIETIFSSMLYLANIETLLKDKLF